MKLLPITFNNNIQTKNPTFESKTKVIYKDLKQIPGLKCGCCGRNMINHTKLENAYKAVSKSLSTMLKNDAFEFLKAKSAEVFEFIQRLAGKYPDKNLDKILEEHPEDLQSLSRLIYNNQNKKYRTPLEARKEDRDANNLYSRIRRDGRHYMKSSSVVMKRFASLKKYLDGEKLKTFEQLEIYADKYPKKTLSEIINLKEVYEFHLLKSRLQFGELCEKRNYHFSKINKLVAKTNPEAFQAFEELKVDAIDLISSVEDPAARIPKLKELYSAALKEHGCEKIQDKVFAELEQIPVVYINKDSFLAYAKQHNYSDIAILESLFNPVVVSEDHILAVSKDGSNSTGNKLMFCRGCNKNRGNDSYAETIKYHPRMPYFIQNQVNDISKYILSGNMHPRFDFWPIYVKESVEKESEGKIKLNVDKFIEKQDQQSTSRMNQYFDKKHEINAQIDALKAELKALEQESGNVKQQIKKENNFRHQLNNLTQKNKKD